MIFSLPNALQAKVNITNNEILDTSNINRIYSYLLENDTKLLYYYSIVAQTTVGNGMVSDINNIVDIDLDAFATYLIENSIISTSDVYKKISLANLIDVCVPTGYEYTHGDYLIWSKELLCFVPAFSVLSPNLIYTTNKSVYAPITGYTCRGDGTASCYINSISFTPISQVFDFDITKFSVNLPNPNNLIPPPQIEFDSIDGFFIECSNFGQTNGTGNCVWKTEVLYPNNMWVTVNSHTSLNQDDDGGTSKFIFVPWDNTTDKLSIKISLYNSLSTYFNNDIGLNKATIIGIKYRDQSTQIYPYTTTQYLKTGIISGDIELSGNSIDSGTTIIDPSVKTWYSEGINLINDFGSYHTAYNTVFPIAINKDAILTDIDILGYASTDITDVDLGTDELITFGILMKGNFKLDWSRSTMTGIITYYKSDLVIGTGHFVGKLNGDDIKCSSTGFTGIEINGIFNAEYHLINKLPVICDSKNKVLVQNLTYIIKNQNIGYLDTSALGVCENKFTAYNPYAIFETFNNEHTFTNADLQTNQLIIATSDTTLHLPSDDVTFGKTVEVIKINGAKVTILYKNQIDTLTYTLINDTDSNTCQFVKLGFITNAGSNGVVNSWQILDTNGYWVEQ